MNNRPATAGQIPDTDYQEIGGDLDDLRLAANALVDLANVYSTNAAILGFLPEHDESKYGETHQEWSYVVSVLEAALRFTNDRLVDGGNALVKAILAYAYVDGDNAKELTEAGTEYLEILNNPNKSGEDPIHALFPLHTLVPAPDVSDAPDGWENNHG